MDEEGNVFGGVVVNSSINNVPINLKKWHIPLQQYRYPFLKYDSYINCLELKVVPIDKFYKWEDLGKMEEIDVSLIIDTIRKSPKENIEHGCASIK